MQTLETLSLQHDHVALIGEIAYPNTTGPHPAVLVMHNALGIDDLVRDKARELAQRGYVAVVTDMYGRAHRAGDANASGAFMMRLVEQPEQLRARVVAWYETIQTLAAVDANRIAAIGYCFGGRCVLELARSGADVKAVVSYHGILSTHQRAQPQAIKGHVAIYTGGQDPYAPAADVDALRKELSEAQAKFQITVFSDACHAFTDPRAERMGRPGIAYNALADQVSWAGTLALLQNVF